MQVVLQPMAVSTESIEAALAIMQSGGLEAMLELLPFGDYYDIWDDARHPKLIADVTESGVRVHSVHAPFGGEIDLSSLDPNHRDRAVREIRKSIEVCAALDGRIVVIHPGDALRTDAEEERMARALDAMPALARAAEEAGVRLAVENLPPGYVGARMAGVMRVVEAAGSRTVGVCFDAGHANLHTPFESPTPAGDRLYEIHAHDNHGAKDEHLAPGLGIIDWPDLRSSLDSIGYSEPILLECAPAQGSTWIEMIAEFRRLTGYTG